MVEFPYHECPSFERCNCNVCPLDPLIKEKNRLPNEEKCRAHKPTRLRIGSMYPELLPFQGLTSREYNGKMKWNALSSEEKEKTKERLSKSLKSQSSSTEN